MKNERELEKIPNTDELFAKYMYMIGKNDEESIYRLKADSGEGIIRRYNVDKGIELVYSEIESYIPCYRENKRFPKCIEIMYMVEGHAEFVMENRRCASVSKGDIAIFNTRVGTKVCTLKDGGMRNISIIVFLDDLADDLNNLFNTKRFDKNKIFADVLLAESCICFPANEMLQRAFEELLQLPENYALYYRKLLTFQIIMGLLDRKEGKNRSYQYFSGDTGNKVHEARKILGEDLSNDMPIETLSKLVRLNRTTLQRVFRQMYGVTIYEYRTHVRMQEAKNLLLDDELSITEISGKCGYTNSSKFAACFKKVTGMTPGEWRRK